MRSSRIVNDWKHFGRSSSGIVRRLNTAEYTPDLQDVVTINEVSPEVTEIYTTERTGLKNGYIYTLVHSAEGWKLDRKQKVLRINGKILESVL